MKRMISVTALVVVGGLLCGCGQKAPILPEDVIMPDLVLEQFTTQESQEVLARPDIAGAWFQTGGAATWPDGIPDDIPPFEGQIDTVMAGGNRVRIFYHNIPDKQLESYLALLESKGFNLEYVVYTQEGHPDNSEERLKKGDYDAVNITRDNYKIRIGYGAGDVTYDIEGVVVDMSVRWPDELAGLLPQPEGSEILSIYPVQDSSISIDCKTNTANAMEQYVDQLEKAGYAVVHENFNQNHEWIDVSMSDRKTTVQFRTYPPDRLGLQIWLVGSDELEGGVLPENINKKWAKNVPGNVPVFTEGELKSALGSDPITFIYEVIDEGAPERYTQQLVNAGFAETNRIDGMDDALISATYSDGKTNVQLMSMSGGQIAIAVKAE